jgi:RNA polymerase sigma factor (sigma-70 family)
MPPERPFDPDADAARLAAADPEAFERLHRRLEKPVRLLFIRRSRRTDLAEELAQQTWTQVWRVLRLGRYDPSRARITTFVYAIAHKIWLQYCRTLSQPKPAGLGNPLDESAEPEQTIHHAELLDALRNCMESRDGVLALDESERRIIEGVARSQSEREMARDLGVSASTINARKQSAYKKLRRCLASKGFPAESVEQMDLLLE